MELLKNILIKEVGSLDKVIYVDNLPKSLLFRRVKKMVIDPYDNQQRVVPEYNLVDGRKIPTNATEDELLPGIEKSPTGDGAFVFFLQMNEAKERLNDIKRFIKDTAPVAERLPEAVPYAVQPGIMSSGTIPLHNIPRVVLPEPVSPPVAKAAVQVEAHTEALPAKKERKPMSEANKAAAKERLARAREIRRAQQIGEIKA